MVLRYQWMVSDDGWIMSLLNGFGGLLNMNVCIFMRLNQEVKPEIPLKSGLYFITQLGHIHHLMDKHQMRFIMRNGLWI